VGRRTATVTGDSVGPPAGLTGPSGRVPPLLRLGRALPLGLAALRLGGALLLGLLGPLLLGLLGPLLLGLLGPLLLGLLGPLLRLLGPLLLGLAALLGLLGALAPSRRPLLARRPIPCLVPRLLALGFHPLWGALPVDRGGRNGAQGSGRGYRQDHRSHG
jgi:hypothetical protein